MLFILSIICGGAGASFASGLFPRRGSAPIGNAVAGLLSGTLAYLAAELVVVPTGSDPFSALLTCLVFGAVGGAFFSLLFRQIHRYLRGDRD